jgi:hypothetical protein
LEKNDFKLAEELSDKVFEENEKKAREEANAREEYRKEKEKQKNAPKKKQYFWR